MPMSMNCVSFRQMLGDGKVHCISHFQVIFVKKDFPNKKDEIEVSCSKVHLEENKKREINQMTVTEIKNSFIQQRFLNLNLNALSALGF